MNNRNLTVSGVLLFAIGVLLAVPSVAEAQRVSADTLLSADKYLHWEEVSDPQISPDGSKIVYERSRVDRTKDDWTSEIWVMNTDGSRNRFLTEGSNPRWSPEGNRIAYLAEGEPGGTQIYVRWMDVEEAVTQITHVERGPSGIKWGPNGEHIAFAMPVSAEKGWDVPMPDPPEGAEWTKKPRVVHRFHYRFDGVGSLEDNNQHLFVVPADGGTPRQITEGDWFVGASYEGPRGTPVLSWTPDGGTILFHGRRGAAVDTTYRRSTIWAANVESKEVRRLTNELGTWQAPNVSPDGETVAFRGYSATDYTYTASDIWTMPIDGGEKRRLTGDLDRSAQSLHWASDGSGLYFTAENEGSSNVRFASRNGGVTRVTDGTHMLSLSSVSDDGVAVGTSSSFRSPYNVVRYSLEGSGDIRKLTAVNQDILKDVQLADVEEIRYRSTDGSRIQGWIVKPPGFDPSQEYPLILSIHGGPHSMYEAEFNFRFQNFAANGFVVLYTNPRGSTGYGNEFARWISQDYPSVDHTDLMTGVDSLLNRGYIDADRQFVTGCSGGGKLSSWAIGHTDRFAAAAVRCPVTDWLSFAGTSDIPFFGHMWFEEPFWEDPSSWLNHSSLMYVGNVSTPTLIMTGELDLRTPMEQSEQFYQALKWRGVPTALVRFNEEYHGTGSKPSNLIRGQMYMMEWFENEGRIDGVTEAGGG